MATPQSVTVVHGGLSGAFDKTFPQIPSSGTCNHQGMPYQSHLNETLGLLSPENHLTLYTYLSFQRQLLRCLSREHP